MSPRTTLSRFLIEQTQPTRHQHKRFRLKLLPGF